MKTTANDAKKNPGCLLAFGCFHTGLTCLGTYLAIIRPLMKDGEVHYRQDDELYTITLDDLSHLVEPGIVIGVLLLGGLTMIYFGVKLMRENR